MPVEDLEKALGHRIDGSVTASWEEQTGRFVEEKSHIHTETVPIVAALLGKDTAKPRSPLVCSLRR